MAPNCTLDFLRMLLFADLWLHPHVLSCPEINCNVYVRAQGPVLSCREVFACPPPFLLLIFRTRYIIVIFCRSPHNRYVAYMHKKYMDRFVFSSTRDRRKMGLIQAKLFPWSLFENVWKKVPYMVLLVKNRWSARVKGHDRNYENWLMTNKSARS